MKAAQCILLLLSVLPGLAGEPLFREDFDQLKKWEPLTFPSIKAHSSYTVTTEGDATILRAESEAAASGMRHLTTFDPHTHPVVSWRWKIDGVLSKGNAATKAGDDYPMRIYIIFPYDPSKASFKKRALYRLAKARQGEYPPGSSLNYIWANRPQTKRIIPNAYTEYAQMIVLQTGADKAGQWQAETIDILKDYKAAYGKAAPREAALAIMIDTDNTGQSAAASLDYIEVRSAD